MKKTIVLAVVLSVGLFFACKKKETKTEDASPTTTGTPTPIVFGDGFKIDDNTGYSVVADSSFCRPSESYGCWLKSYKGEFENLMLRFKTKKLSTKTYPVDSLVLNTLMYGMYGYDFSGGSVTFSSISATKASGTFTFNVKQQVGTSARTQVTGTFNNITVR